ALDVDDHGVALAAAGADRDAAVAAAAPAQLEHERADDAGAGGADRVPERDRAAVDVHALLVDAEHARRVQGDRSEGLVDLQRSMSPGCRPALSSAFLAALAGVRASQANSSATAAWATIVPRMSLPLRSAQSSLAS